jgi:hypothetical protein
LSRHDTADSLGYSSSEIGRGFCFLHYLYFPQNWHLIRSTWSPELSISWTG